MQVVGLQPCASTHPQTVSIRSSAMSAAWLLRGQNRDPPRTEQRTYQGHRRGLYMRLCLINFMGPNSIQSYACAVGTSIILITPHGLLPNLRNEHLHYLAVLRQHGVDRVLLLGRHRLDDRVERRWVRPINRHWLRRWSNCKWRWVGCNSWHCSCMTHRSNWSLRCWYRRRNTWVDTPRFFACRRFCSSCAPRLCRLCGGRLCCAPRLSILCCAPRRCGCRGSRPWCT